MSAVTVAINLIATDGTSAAFSSFTGTMTGAAARLQGFRGLLKGISPEFAALGAGLVGSAAAFELFKIPVETGIKDAAELETRLTQLRFATQDTADDMPLLTSAVTDLAIQTKYGVGEATGAFEQLVEMGFSTQEILYGMGDGANALMDGAYHAKEATHGLGMEALYLGQALRADATDGAQLLGAVLHTFHNDGMDAAQAADYLAAAFLNGVPSVTLLQQAIRNGGSTAAALKIPFKDFAITLDLLSQSGLSANQAATSLNYYLAQLSSPTLKAAKALSDLGLITMNDGPKLQAFEAQLRKAGAAGVEAVKGFDGSVTSLQNMYNAGKDLGLIPLDKSFMAWAAQSGIMNNVMFDAQGNFIGTKESVLKLRDALEKMPDGQRLAYIRDIFNIRGGQDARLFAAMDGFAERYDGLSDRFEKTDLGKLASQQLGTLAGAMDQLSDSFHTALATAFLPLLPKITEMVQGVSGLVSQFQQLDPQVREGIAVFLLVGTVVTGLTVLVLGIIVAIAGFIAILETAGVSIAAVGTGLAAVAGGIVVLGGVIAAIIALKQQMEDNTPIGNFFTKLTGGMISAGEQAKTTAGSFDDLGVQTLGLQGYTKQLTGVYGGLHDELDTAKDTWKTLHDNTKDNNDELDRAAQNYPTVIGILNNGGPIVKTYGDNMGTTADNTKKANDSTSNLSSSLDHLGQSFQNLGTQLGQFQGAWNVLLFVLMSVGGVLNGIVMGVEGYFSSVLTGVINMASGVVNVVAGLFQVLLGITGDFFAVLGDVLHGDTDKVGKDMQKAFSDLGEGIGSIWQGICDFFTGLWQATVGALIQGVVSFVQGVISWFQNMFDTLVGHSIIPDMVNAIINWVKNLVKWFTDHIHDLVNRVTTYFGDLKDKATTKLTELVTTGKSKAGELKDKLLDEVSKIPGKAAETFQSLLDKAKTKLSDLKNIGLDAGKGLVQNLIDGINSMLESLRRKVADLANIIHLPLGHSVPSEGPLKDDDQWGAHFVENLIVGMERRRRDLASTVAAIAGTVRGGLNTPQLSASGSGGGTIVIPITLDGKQIAEYSLDLTTKQLRRMGSTRYAR